MNSLELRAAQWRRGGQCGRCTKAIWQRGRVTGCGHGADLPGAIGQLAAVQAALLFQLAQAPGAPHCVARELLQVGQDAYLASDRPDP